MPGRLRKGRRRGRMYERGADGVGAVLPLEPGNTTPRSPVTVPPRPGMLEHAPSAVHERWDLSPVRARAGLTCYRSHLSCLWKT
jgi:hypothetical protein